MDSTTVANVQNSFSKVEPISEQAAEMFYARLFELRPDYKDLFKHDMKDQGKKLMATLSLAVKSLNDLEKIVPAVEELGRKHVDYGVKDEDYQVVGQALIETLEKGLGDDFTPEVKQSWIDVYLTLAEVMIGAARASRQE